MANSNAGNGPGTPGTDPETHLENTEDDKISIHSDRDNDVWEDIEQVYYKDPGLTDIEDLSDYRPGGFHPISYGNVLDNRFEVISKLGHGGFATVWLCLDVSSDPSDDEASQYDDDEEPQRYNWRAIKIIRADMSPNGVENWPSIRLRNYFERTLGLSRADWEAHDIMLPLEHFWIEGPNGRHLCEVGAVHGSSLVELWEPRMPPEKPTQLKYLLYRAGKALSFLHQHGICHGDFTPGNILLRMDSDALENLSRSEMVALLEERRSAEVETRNAAGERGGPGDHGPYFVYESADLSNLPLRNDEVAIVDFGECFWPAEQGGTGPPDWSGVPIEFAAPEALYNCGVGPWSDVWAFACGIPGCLLRAMLFNKDRNRAAAWFEATLGEPMPERFRLAQINEIRRQLREAVGVTDEQREWAEGEIERLEAGKEEDEEEAREEVARAKAETGHDDPILARISRERVYRDWIRDTNGDISDEHKLMEIVQRMPRKETQLLADLLGKVYKWEPEDRIDIEAVLAHEYFADKQKPIGSLKPSPYDIMQLDPLFTDSDDGNQKEKGTGTSTPFVEDPITQVENEVIQEPETVEEIIDEESDEEVPGEEPNLALIPDPQPAPPPPRLPTGGLHPIIFRIGRFLDEIRTGFITQWNVIQDWRPTPLELSQIMLGMIAAIVLWILVFFVLVPKAQSWLFASNQQQCPRNTLLVPMTLRSSTSTYSRGLLAFSAPKVEGSTNSSCTCVVAKGFSGY